MILFGFMTIVRLLICYLVFRMNPERMVFTSQAFSDLFSIHFNDACAIIDNFIIVVFVSVVDFYYWRYCLPIDQLTSNHYSLEIMFRFLLFCRSQLAGAQSITTWLEWCPMATSAQNLASRGCTPELRNSFPG